MVEPLAGSILNSLRPSSISLKRSSTTLARTINVSNRPSLATNFFTPIPRDVKGKGKATVADDTHFFVTDCRRWTCFESRHSIWCPENTRSHMLRELENQRAPPSSTAPLTTTRVHRYRMRSPNSHSRKVLYPTQIRRASQVAVSEVFVQQPLSVVPPESVRSFVDRLKQMPEQLSMEDESVLWRDFQDLLGERVLQALPPDDILDFTRKLLSRIQSTLLFFDDPHIPYKWGAQLRALLNQPHVRQFREPSPLIYSLSARILALGDRIDDAKAQFAHIPFHEGELYLETSVTIGFALACYCRLQDLLEFSFLENKHLATYPERVYEGTIRRGIGFHPRLRDIFVALPPWGLPQLTRLSNFLLTVALHHQPFEVYQRVISLKRHSFLPFDENLLAKHSRFFVHKNQLGHAQTVLRLITNRQNPNYLDASLYLASKQGDFEQSHRFFNLMQKRNCVSEHAISYLLNLYTKKSAKDVHKLFNEFFPLDSEGRRMNYPKVGHYNVILQSHVRRSDVDGVNSLLKEMAVSGLVPDSYTFTAIIEVFASQGNLESIYSVLSGISSNELQVRKLAYTSIITLLGRRSDYRAADDVFRRACAEGIIPDSTMIQALMHCYSLSGNWKGVVRLYDYLSSSKAPPTVDFYNIVLKALILLGAPFQYVSPVYDTIRSLKLTPDDCTFPLLLQSACNSDDLGAAMCIFDQVYNNPEEVHLLTVHSYTIIITALCARRDKDGAKRMFRLMLDRGIKPSLLTYIPFVRMLCDNTRGRRLASKFIHRILCQEKLDSPKPDKMDKTPLVSLFQPLIQAALHKNQFAEAERYYDDYFKAGGAPSITLLNIFLRAYRDSSDLESFLDIWNKILDIARPHEQQTKLGLPEAKVRNIQGPFSTYLDMMARHGHFQQLSAQWKEFNNLGFQFDCSNWNRLLQALIRFGRLPEALNIVEKVILPYRGLALSYNAHANQSVDRSRQPSLMPDNPLDSVLRPPIRFARQQRLAATHFRRRGIYSDRFPRLLMRQSTDHMYRMQVFQHFGGQFDTWRLYWNTVQMTIDALLQLYQGRSTEVVQEGEISRVFVVNKPRVCMGIIRKIKRQSPMTLHMINKVYIIRRPKHLANTRNPKSLERLKKSIAMAKRT